MWQMLGDVVRGDYRMSWLTTFIIILTIGYIVFPFDLLPDFIPVIGWVDDIAAGYLLVKRLVSETQRYIRYKAMDRKNHPLDIDKQK